MLKDSGSSARRERSSARDTRPSGVQKPSPSRLGPEARARRTGRVEEGQRGLARVCTCSSKPRRASTAPRSSSSDIDGLPLLQREPDERRGARGHRRGPRIEQDQPLVREQLGEHAGERGAGDRPAT